jgi:Predicted esterase of the alpha-beta hydrolase superfamily
MARKKIGLALSGGGARGFAHIGVLKVFAEHNIPIDLVAGTSAGSFVGGAFACGLSIDEIIKIARKIGWFNMTGFSYSPRGILSNAPMGKFIRENFPILRFEDLKIPFTAVACDLESGDQIVLKDEGDLELAIRASCAVPGVFLPVNDEIGRTLVDGGVVAPVPTQVVREMGADIVIAVDLLASGASFRNVPRTMVGMLLQSAMTMLRTVSKHQHYHADIVIIPQIGHLRPDEISKRDEFIKLGEEAALERIEEVEQLIEAGK